MQEESRDMKKNLIKIINENYIQNDSAYMNDSDKIKWKKILDEVKNIPTSTIQGMICLVQISHKARVDLLSLQISINENIVNLDLKWLKESLQEKDKKDRGEKWRGTPIEILERIEKSEKQLKQARHERHETEEQTIRIMVGYATLIQEMKTSSSSSKQPEKVSSRQQESSSSKRQEKKVERSNKDTSDGQKREGKK